MYFKLWAQILNDLQALRELTVVEERLRKLLQEGSYPEVVQTYLDSRDTGILLFFYISYFIYCEKLQ